MQAIKPLFKRELTFIEDVNDQEELFNIVGKRLKEKGIVNEDFTEALIERERNYPTGLDLSPVSNDIPNAAIPHADTEYCNDKAIVFVKLNNPISFYNMIAPDKNMDVRYLFFIINNQKESQTNVLSELMGFLTVVDNVKALEAMQTKDEIFQFLTEENSNIKN
ncbi:PTS sugar transporter subunit IIA [Lentibacillus cibarius]|uniref:PTS sugar transporter subunit IIA n=1 Tax=Lentibacillus cibarius TaxID=2583219 RepID=A0A549YET9_9BACI|nr:PTS sugar transporter subunit IIA [Lentibacillus cibarius]TMN21487.1 PTS sugar transporter subunit IIA [Lentibacillus cibarius]TRM10385.1 PTS sugar transporter subunit IIA [Lentibacillus cibarius]